VSCPAWVDLDELALAPGDGLVGSQLKLQFRHHPDVPGPLAAAPRQGPGAPGLGLIFKIRNGEGKQQQVRP
jgi:hypothetical protein